MIAAPARRGALIAVLGLGFIAAMTLTPAPHNVERVALTPLWCLRCGDLAGMDIILNVILFVPFGFGLRLAGWPRSRVVLVAFLTTVFIETTQYFFIVGRDATLSDLLTNTTGGVVGMILAERFGLLVSPAPGPARWLAALSAAFWLLAQAVTAWGMAVTLPERPFWGQLAPELGQFDRFRGEVIDAKIAGEPMPSARLADTPTIRRRLLAGQGIEARAVAGPPPARLAPIASVFDEGQQEIILLGQQRTDLVFRIHTRAWSLGLRGPSLLVPEAIPADSGRQFLAEGHLANGYMEARADARGGSIGRTLALSPSLGWSLLLPFENYAFGDNVRLLTALWLAGLLLPVGYFTARAQRPGLGPPVLLGALIVVGIAGMCWLFRLPPANWSEWAAAIGGAGSGWGLGRGGAL
ncbi:MAG TPA: VanZ family protein [Gemmatimonadales bacterium]|nr:VanZ family protein [Gemmatimonadales bacterium]